MSQVSRDAEKSGDFDAVIVGAGFAGLYMLHRLRGMGLKARILEAGGAVGGTWYWNRYPGARCDVESMQYSYQFSEELQQEWEWAERYATQPEILRYANHVADRFDLRRDIRFDTCVTAATFDETASRWIVETDDGARLTASYCVMATGCLSSFNKPSFEGIDSFEGSIYYTGQWPHEEVDFSDRRVGVIGTGASAIQSIPLIAQQAEHLFVFQRTPNYAVPAHNAPLDPDVVRETKADYAGFRERAKQMPTGFIVRYATVTALEAGPEEREREYQARWRAGGLPFMAAYPDLLFDAEANETAAEFVRGKIREAVRDPEIAELLSPRNIIGAKRLCVDTGYFETYNRSNVTLIDISAAPIEGICADGIRARGEEYKVDAIVFATGFDAMTGALLNVDIRGRGGLKLSEKWAGGPRNYLGLTVAGFPNLFTITGPGSPSVFTNMIPSIEQHVEWIADCVGYMRERGLVSLEASVEAEDAWVAHVAEVGGASLRSRVDTWYDGANIPGKPRTFMPYIGGFPVYAQKCADVAANGYEGFVLS
jgi:cyclohexanone monooxygenase